MSLKCSECEFTKREKDKQGKNRLRFTCDPYNNIKEPECLQKWIIVKLSKLEEFYGGLVANQSKSLPFLSKLMKIIKRETDDLDEGEKWKKS